MTTTTLTTKGQIVIPSKVREKMDLKKGTVLSVDYNGRDIILRPLTKEYFQEMSGVLDSKGKLTKKLLKERKKRPSKGR